MCERTLNQIELLVIFLLSCCTFNGATVLLPSPSYVDVSNAVRVSSVGDTLLVPPGIAVWSNVLVISNGINLIGAGTNLTFITNEIPDVAPWSLNLFAPLIWLRISNDTPVRISKFSFFCSYPVWDAPNNRYTNGGMGVLADPISLTGFPIVHNLRIDHCFFENGVTRAIELLGSVYGVVDHCKFKDCILTCEPVAGDDIEWNRFTPPYYGLGTTNTIVFEDNTIIWTDAAHTNWNLQPAPCASGQGGHYVWRYNLIDQQGHFNADGLDVHGNNFYHSFNGSRGSIWLECYSNTFNLTTFSIRALNIRGGTIMIFNNQFIGTADANRIIMEEEEGWTNAGSHFVPYLTNWPAQDQITNSFIWGNARNGVATNWFTYYYPNQDSIFIQEGRDVWKQSPWETPYTNGEGAVNLMINYQPLVYPHPLVTSQDGIVHAQIKGKAKFLGKATIR